MNYVNGRDELWHGVVIRTGLKSCRIYWVGCPSISASKRQAKSMNGNPVKVDRAIIRWHQPDAGAKEGDFPSFSVSWIKDNYISKSFGKEPEVVVISDSDEEGDASGKAKACRVIDSAQPIGMWVFSIFLSGKWFNKKS